MEDCLALCHLLGGTLRRVIGALRRVHALLRQGLDTIVERLLGVETTKFVRLRQLGLAAAGRVDYEPSSWLVLRRVLGKHEVTENDVFIDFGSGKGRVVYQAALYPFKKVIGVELSSELTAIAQSNIAHALPRLRCRNIELLSSDVLEYDIPDDVTVAYFYNPFEGDVFAAVIDKLVASLQRQPRTLRVIYSNPRENEILLRAGAQLLRVASNVWPLRIWAKASATHLYIFSAPQTTSPRFAPERH